MSAHVVQVSYVIAAALFILCLKWMSSPVTARRRVVAGEVGMLLAIVGTLLRFEVVSYEWIFAGFLLIIPGLISDIIAVALLIPPVRHLVIRRSLLGVGRTARQEVADPDAIEVSYQRLEEPRHDRTRKP